jgi:tRNA-splicing ligase RtcB
MCSATNSIAARWLATISRTRSASSCGPSQKARIDVVRHGNQPHPRRRARRRADQDVDARRAVEDEAKRQLTNAARLPIVFKHIAAMPDVHFGIGATVGSVIPTLQGDHPGRGGRGHRLRHDRLQDHADGRKTCRTTWPAAFGHRARGAAWPLAGQPRPGRLGQKAPGAVNTAWAQLEPEFTELCRDYPKLAKTNHIQHLGTLGTGNHFIEVCLDEAGFVWFMLHSGSRGVGNFIGTMFIELAKQDAMRNNANLPDRDLAYFEEGSRYFGDYVRAVGWAQKFAAINREVMMKRVIEAAKTVIRKNFQSHIEAVNCHHNYVQQGAPLRRRRVTSPARAR